MTKRRPVRIEELESRTTLDVALGHSAPALIAPPAGNLAPLVSPPVVLPGPSLVPAPGNQGSNAGELSSDAGYLQALGRIFSDSGDVSSLLNSASQSTHGSIRESAWQFISNY